MRELSRQRRRRRWPILELAVASLVPLLAVPVSCADPISIPASQYWDGNDGPWSSFGITVGTPAQRLRLFAHSGSSTTWVVLPIGCTPDDPSTCANDRGFTYDSTGSSTWSDIGIFELSLVVESELGYAVNASYGRESLGLGYSNDPPVIPDQIIAGMAAKDFFLGSIGLNPNPFNFTNFEDPQPSLLGTLTAESNATNAPQPLLASKSWSYTAGSYRNEPPAFGSLVLGGYDANRFEANDIVFPFGPDISRDLLVAVQSITTGSDKLLTTPSFFLLDTVVPQMWLPLATCRAFETAFGLTYDDASTYYLVSDSQHQKLLSQNPTVTFSIGPATDGDSVDIVLPYSSFDLELSYPLADSKQRYFPIRRANTSDSYILGRAFFQNAHVTVDYDRGNFSVSAAKLPTSNAISENLIAITPPGSASTSSSSSSSLSKGAIIGIAAGGAAALLAALILLFLFLRRRRNNQASQQKTDTANAEDTSTSGPSGFNTFKSELEGSAYKPTYEAEAIPAKWDPKLMSSSQQQQQMEWQEPQELDNSAYDARNKHGAVGGGGGGEIYEMPAEAEAYPRSHPQTRSPSHSGVGYVPRRNVEAEREVEIETETEQEPSESHRLMDGRERGAARSPPPPPPPPAAAAAATSPAPGAGVPARVPVPVPGRSPRLGSGSGSGSGSGMGSPNAESRRGSGPEENYRERAW